MSLKTMPRFGKSGMSRIRASRSAFVGGVTSAERYP
jgi:hypothetical protein